MALLLLCPPSMAEPEEDERVSRKVVYEHSASSGSSWPVGWTIGIIAVIAIAIVVYIVMHLR